MSKHWRNYFLFTHSERNGLLVLIALLILLILANLILPFSREETPPEWQHWKEAEKPSPIPPTSPDTSRRTGVVRPFDPNQATLVQLREAGVPEGLATRWQRYLEKGGRFRKREEVSRLYGMTQNLYRSLEPWLTFPEERPVKRKSEKEGKSVPTRGGMTQAVSSGSIKAVEKPKRQPIDLNQADSLALESLPGIGPVLASRIVRYRKLLGGYCSREQVREVYGMSDELYERAAPFLKADTGALQKLDVNFVSLKDLGRHPYVGYKQARKVIRYRDKNGMFRAKVELGQLFSADSLKKLWPYLETATVNQSIQN
ncbi:MAG: helix-hairpin-helix domain-containing protein [Marinilabiliales bacterium]|nr:helix-hairpin-helix domain-containing protein [Marinilabiliales bacterium]